MELEYVKKHCFSTPASVKRLWKLLDMNAKASPEADISFEGNKCSSVLETADVDLEESELQLTMMLASKSDLLNLIPVDKKPPITLFGRARLGYQSCIAAEEVKTESVKVGHREGAGNAMEQMLPQSNKDGENQVEEPTDNLIKMDVGDTKPDKVLDIDVYKSVSCSSIRSLRRYNNNNLQNLYQFHRKEEGSAMEQKLPHPVNVLGNQVEEPTDNLIKVDVGDTRPDKLLNVDDYRSVFYSSTGSSRGYNDNLRKL